MPQRKSQPVKWSPKGLSDTLDTSEVFEGAMSLLQNLIFDPSTANVWQCRPASQRLTDYSTFPVGGTVGAISCLTVIGNFAFGMIASTSGATTGHDVPFCFNLLSNTFVTISGIVAGNTPTSLPAWSPPATPAAWTPPTMALVGSKVILTHAGFSGTGTNWIGVIDITNPNFPAWSTTNLTGAIQFTVVPTWVQNFGGRAYYIHNASQPAVIFSDILVPTNATNGNQVLTFNDNQALTAMGPLQFNNQLGGQIQSLMVFKGVSNIYQITGDASLNNLSVNTLNVATGTLAPNSITATPKGLAFMAPDGYRIISFQGVVSDPLGQSGQGITLPFINAVVPSRCSSSCNGVLFRASTQNGTKAGTPTEEYWYEFGASRWSGPHLFPISSGQMTVPSLSAEYSNTFICAYAGMPGTLWRSDYYQTTSSTFVENGFQMQWVYQTPNLPAAEQMGNIAMTESTLMCAFGVGTTSFGVSALAPSDAVIATTALTSQSSATIWGAFQWGGAVWGSSLVTLADHQIAWPIPLVSTRISFQVNGNCAQNVKLGTLRTRYQPLSQFLTPAAGVQ